jgi:hypothetical protein
MKPISIQFSSRGSKSLIERARVELYETDEGEIQIKNIYAISPVQDTESRERVPALSSRGA